MATVKPTASESAGLPCSATRFPSTMYPAQNNAASSAKAIPTGSAESCTSAIRTTPTSAASTENPSRRDRDPAAATPIGPRNSIATAVPNGSRSMAR
ncbi:Uncharacterised protein [Mycobacteroides abscessus subsp. massiliense]|nr:Uncharacterised protein [Mycobacteroides abscessus subsp. massiliense]